jgi:hypothetical protein
MLPPTPVIFKEMGSGDAVGDAFGCKVVNFDLKRVRVKRVYSLRSFESAKTL